MLMRDRGASRLLKRISRDAAQGENRRESAVYVLVCHCMAPHFEPVFNAAMRPSGLFQQPARRVILLLAAGLLTACASDQPEDLASAQIQAAAEEPANPDIEVTGLVRQHQYGGDSFLVIEGDDGIHYDPANLPSAFQEPGLRVKMQARKTAGISPRKVGPVLEIVSIDRL